MTIILRHIRIFWYLALWSVIFLAVFTLHPQSAEVLRIYWFDKQFDFFQAIWLVVALAYGSFVFAVIADGIHRRFAAKGDPNGAYPWVISAASALPLMICTIAAVVALSEWFAISRVSLEALKGVFVAVGVLLASLVLIAWGGRPARRVPLSVRVHLLVDSWSARLVLDMATISFAALFLYVPTLSDGTLVHLAIQMGALPIVLISLSVIMYSIYRLVTLELSSRWARLTLIILGILILSFLGQAIANGSVGFALLLIAALAATGYEYRAPDPSFQMAIRAIIFVALISFGFGDITSTSKARDDIPRPSAPLPVLSEAFEVWLNSRTDLNDYKSKDGKVAPYPVFIIAAQGGGLYAAYHTAMVLALLQDRCPRFAQHIFAISGVSGGSLGSAVFANAVERMAADGSKLACDATVVRNEFQEYTKKFLERDFLSPLVFLSIIPNFAQRLLAVVPLWLQKLTNLDLGLYDRARGLEYGFELASAEVDRDNGPISNFFQKGTLGIWQPRGVAPALVFNTTRADTGEPYWIAPFRATKAQPDSTFEGIELGDIDFRQKVVAVENPNIDLRISTAVGLSARFPFVTPPGSLEIGGRRWLEKQDKFQAVGFVDGGYFENSGFETAWRLASTIKESRDGIEKNRDKNQGPLLIGQPLHPVSIEIIPIGEFWGLRYSHFRNHQFLNMKISWLDEKYSDLIPPSDVKSPISTELLAPLNALNASRQYRAWYALLGMLGTSKLLPDNTTTSINLSDALFGLTAEKNQFPVGWHMTSHTFSRIQQRIVKPIPEAPCGLSLSNESVRKAEFEQLQQFGEDLSGFVDRWLYGCAAGFVTRTLSP